MLELFSGTLMSWLAGTEIDLFGSKVPNKSATVKDNYVEDCSKHGPIPINWMIQFLHGPCNTICILILYGSMMKKGWFELKLIIVWQAWILLQRYVLLNRVNSILLILKMNWLNLLKLKTLTDKVIRIMDREKIFAVLPYVLLLFASSTIFR